jgi:hypothetical protein
VFPSQPLDGDRTRFEPVTHLPGFLSHDRWLLSTSCPGGDRNRNDRLAWLRVLLPVEHTIVGIDLADDKQAAVVADHDLVGLWPDGA